MFGALKRGRFRSLASLILVVNVVGELQQKRTLAASRGFLAAARLSCLLQCRLLLSKDYYYSQNLFRPPNLKYVIYVYPTPFLSKVDANLPKFECGLLNDCQGLV